MFRTDFPQPSDLVSFIGCSAWSTQATSAVARWRFEEWVSVRAPIGLSCAVGRHAPGFSTYSKWEINCGVISWSQLAGGLAHPLLPHSPSEVAPPLRSLQGWELSSRHRCPLVAGCLTQARFWLEWVLFAGCPGFHGFRAITSELLANQP